MKLSPAFSFLCHGVCVCLSVHHLAFNPHGISIIFLTWEKWVRGQLPRHEVVKDEEGPGELPARAGKGKTHEEGSWCQTPCHHHLWFHHHPCFCSRNLGCSLTSNKEPFRESCGLVILNISHICPFFGPPLPPL